MGGQQFDEGCLLLDMRRMRRVLALDAVRGVVDVEDGHRMARAHRELAHLQ